MSRYYTNFVKPSNILQKREVLSGVEAKKIYIEELNRSNSVSHSTEKSSKTNSQKISQLNREKSEPIADKDLFLLVQNNNVQQLRSVLDDHPERLHCLDKFGWSLLMIACQANAVEVVQELLKRGIDTSVRDKAGNSASSLIIRNRNVVICDILLNFRLEDKKHKHSDKHKYVDKPKEDFFCERCNKTYPDKEKHLSSTIHNISASKGKKNIASYAIPTSNKGFQIMLKTGWNKDRGLGPEGSGKIYPIKPVQKLDRQGLGHKKPKLKEDAKHGIHKKSKLMSNSQYDDRRFEISFRREFY